MMDFPQLVAFAQDNRVPDLVVPGPEAPLVAGITDAMEIGGHSPVAGPVRRRRNSEGSKTVHQAKSPTPPVFPRRNGNGLSDAAPPVNLSAAGARRSWSRADGFAAGKGVVVATVRERCAGPR